MLQHIDHSNNQEQNEILNSERYSIMGKELGEGTYGVVYQAKDNIMKDLVAIKKIKLEKEEEGMPSTAMREIAILKELNHPNVINLRDVIYKPQQKLLLLVFQYLDNDLKKFLDQNKNTITSTQIKNIMYQILCGMNYCHSHRIIHRDIKPQNILIDNQGNVKLADFGLARAFSVPIRTLTHEIETLWYRAPEVLLGQKQYSLPVDMWSIGCIFHELVEKKPLFMGDCEIDQIFKIFQLHGTPSPQDWPSVQDLPDFKPTFPQFRAKDFACQFKQFDNNGLDLFYQMIQIDPAKRISVKEALNHPYFNDIKKQQFVSQYK